VLAKQVFFCLSQAASPYLFLYIALTKWNIAVIVLQVPFSHFTIYQKWLSLFKMQFTSLHSLAYSFLWLRNIQK
jgi:hypothetical protein